MFMRKFGLSVEFMKNIILRLEILATNLYIIFTREPQRAAPDHDPIFKAFLLLNFILIRFQEA